MVINYDEWGGFFDHVPPPRVTAGVPVGADPSTGIDHDLDGAKLVLLGFRVPCIVASPFTGVQAGATPVAHGLYDHTSVLKLIEWRWGLSPLTQRDASTASTDPGNLASILNLAAPSPRVPRQIPTLPPFVPTACTAPLPSVTSPSAASLASPSAGQNGSDEREAWIGLQQSGLLAGWK
jgi:phospholipase C